MEESNVPAGFRDKTEKATPPPRFELEDFGVKFPQEPPQTPEVFLKEQKELQQNQTPQTQKT